MVLPPHDRDHNVCSFDFISIYFDYDHREGDDHFPKSELRSYPVVNPGYLSRVKRTPVCLAFGSDRTEGAQEIEAIEEKAASVSQGIVKPDNPLAPDRYHAIQVGAFRNWEYARDLIEIFKGKEFDVYWISMERRNRGIYTKSSSGTLWLEMKRPSLRRIKVFSMIMLAVLSWRSHLLRLDH